MARLRLQGVEKSYGKVRTVRDISPAQSRTEGAMTRLRLKGIGKSCGKVRTVRDISPGAIEG